MYDLYDIMNKTYLAGDGVYTGAAYDGSCYYLVCGDKIIKQNADMSCNFSETIKYKTKRCYEKICYDNIDCCFWASTASSCRKIYKLNECFEEIDYIILRHDDACCNKITGLSFNCCSNALFVSTGVSICKYYKNTKKTKNLYKSCREIILGISSVCPGYIVYAVDNNKKYIYIYNKYNICVKKHEIPCGYSVFEIIFNPCDLNLCNSSENDDIIFDIFIHKNSCYPYVYKIRINNDTLTYCPCLCNYTICKNIFCCNKCSPGKKDKCDLIESIAMIEAAISNILNAEGEKLQKIIEKSDDIEQILCVNKQVNKTIVSATHLEHVLYDKLSVISNACDCCNNCDSCKHDKHCKCCKSNDCECGRCDACNDKCSGGHKDEKGSAVYMPKQTEND